MLIEISVDDLIHLYRLASLGKVIGGLVHNLNGPLQNLALDIEMTNHLLSNKSPIDENTTNNVLKRIKRMGEEFERIDQLIKTSAIRASQDDDNYHFLHINEFIQQEFIFNKNNLYFKHNVHTEYKFQKNLPTFRDLPKELIIALSSFFHAIVDELESQTVKGLIVKTSMDDMLKITIDTKDGTLSDRFMEQFKQEIPESSSLTLTDQNMDILFPLVLFRNLGASASGKALSSGSRIILMIPMSNPLS